jgi:glycosyltransferase involved in cell wall biosynthesis
MEFSSLDNILQKSKESSLDCLYYIKKKNFSDELDYLGLSAYLSLKRIRLKRIFSFLCIFFNPKCIIFFDSLNSLNIFKAWYLNFFLKKRFIVIFKKKNDGYGLKEKKIIEILKKHSFVLLLSDDVELSDEGFKFSDRFACFLRLPNKKVSSVDPNFGDLKKLIKAWRGSSLKYRFSIHSYHYLFSDGITNLMRIFDYFQYEKLRDIVTLFEKNKYSIEDFRDLSFLKFLFKNQVNYQEVLKNKISVIIPTIGDRESLKRILDSIEKDSESCLPYECIIVENSKDQNLSEFVSSLKFSFEIQYVYIPMKGLARAYNRGLEKARGNFIIFFNDDVLIPQGFFSAYHSVIDLYSSGVFVGGGLDAVYEEKPSKGILRVWPTSSKSLSISNTRKYSKRFLGANWGAFLCDIYAAGCFDENLGLGSSSNSTGEEVDLQQKLLRLGLKPIYLEGVSVKHSIPKFKYEWSWNYNRNFQNGVALAIRNHDHFRLIFIHSLLVLLKCFMFIVWPSKDNFRIIVWKKYYLKGVISGMKLVNQGKA